MRWILNSEDARSLDQQKTSDVHLGVTRPARRRPQGNGTLLGACLDIGSVAQCKNHEGRQLYTEFVWCRLFAGSKRFDGRWS